MDHPLEPERVPRPRLAWLQAQTSRWREAGIVDETACGRILAAYEPEPEHGPGTHVLLLLASLMVGIGVLLLIGYNWNRIGPVTKVALTMTGVAAAFGAAAVAFARRHPLTGETLALIGTFAFANSIWLIAQVLHIQGHFPDGFMWSAVGALAASAILRSRWIGIEAAVFALVWVGAAGIAPPHAPAWRFLIFAPAALAVAYHLRSPVMLRIAAFTGALWVLLLDPTRLDDDAVFFAAAALTACAFYAIGAAHQADASMRRAWQTTGLAVLLVLFPALLTTDFHEWTRGGDWRTLAFAVAVAATVATGTMALWHRREAAGLAVTVVAAILMLWAVLLVAGVEEPHYLWVVVFSALALLLSIALLRNALRTHDAPAFAFGVVLGLEFIVVRWASVVENMLWSGLMLLAAGGGLLVVARLWLDRDRQVAASGRMS